MVLLNFRSNRLRRFLFDFDKEFSPTACIKLKHVWDLAMRAATLLM